MPAPMSSTTAGTRFPVAQEISGAITAAAMIQANDTKGFDSTLPAAKTTCDSGIIVVTMAL